MADGDFYNEYEAFLLSRGRPTDQDPPIVMSKPVNLSAMYNSVQSRGGYEQVSKRKEWRQVFLDCTTADHYSTNTGYYMKIIYDKSMLDFERFKSKGGTVTAEDIETAIASRRGRRSRRDTSTDHDDRSPSATPLKRRGRDAIADPLTPPSSSPLVAGEPMPRRRAKDALSQVKHQLTEEKRRRGRPKRRATSDSSDVEEAEPEPEADEEEDVVDDLDQVLRDEETFAVRTSLFEEDQVEHRPHHHMVKVAEYLDMVDRKTPKGPPFGSDGDRDKWYEFCEDRLREIQAHYKRVRRVVARIDMKLNADKPLNVGEMLNVTAEDFKEDTARLDTDEEDEFLPPFAEVQDGELADEFMDEQDMPGEQESVEEESSVLVRSLDRPRRSRGVTNYEAMEEGDLDDLSDESSDDRKGRVKRRRRGFY